MRMHLIVGFALAFGLATAAQAGPLPKPAGVPVLTVTGNIANVNAEGSALLDLGMLEALGSQRFRTQTPWYDHVVEFEGVPVAALLDYLGAEGEELRAVALDDYESTIPVEDLREHGAILATKRDGEAMPIRDKGPLWIVYPYDSKPELSTDLYYSRSVWGIKEITIK